MEEQIGHSESITAAAFSADGSLAATASAGVITLWDVVSEREIYQIPVSRNAIGQLAITADSLLATTLAPPATTSAFQLTTGQPLRPIKACASGTFAGAVQRVACSADGRQAVVIRAQRAEFWDAAAARKIRAIGAPGKAVALIALSSDGRVAATGLLGEPEVRLWDTSTGVEIRRLVGLRNFNEKELASRRLLMGDQAGQLFYPVNALAFSPDGKMVAGSGLDRSVIVWDTQTGRPVSVFELGLGAGNISCVAFLPDNKRILLASGPAWIYDIAFRPVPKQTAPAIGGVMGGIAPLPKDWKPPAPPPPPPPPVRSGANPPTRTTPTPSTPAIAPPGQALPLPSPQTGPPPAPASAPPPKPVFKENDPSTWDFEDIRRIFGLKDRTMEPVLRSNLSGKLHGARTSRLSPDGRFLFLIWNAEDQNLTAAGYVNNPLLQAFGVVNEVPLRYLDLKSGKSGDWYKGPRVFSVAFSPDGTTVALGHANGLITIWDLDRHALLRTLSPPSREPTAVTMLASDGRAWMAGYNNGEMRVFPNAGIASKFPLPEKVKPDDVLVARNQPYIALGFSPPDSRIMDMLHGITDEISKLPATAASIIVMDARGKAVMQPVLLRFPARGAMAFLPDGNSMVITDGAALSLYDLTRGIKGRDLPDSANVRRIGLSSAGSQIACASYGGEVSVRELADGRVVWKYPRQASGQVQSVSFFDTDRYVMAAQADGTTRFLDARDGRLIATLAQHTSGDWVVITPDGRFDTQDLDSSPPLHWVASDAPLQPLPVEMFQRDYYEPRLLMRVLAGEKMPPLRNVGELNRLRPNVAITAASREGGPFWAR